MSLAISIMCNNNLLLTERKGRTGEYWPKVVAETTESQYSPERSREIEVSKLFIIWNCLFERSDTCSLFPSLAGARKNTSIEDVREYYMLNHRIRDLLLHFKKVFFCFSFIW